jgi:hypothetical protein
LYFYLTFGEMNDIIDAITHEITTFF